MGTIFNIQSVLGTMKLILSTLFKNSTPVLIDATAQYLNQSEERLKNLAEGALNGQLSYPFVIARLREEPINIKAYLLSLGLIATADIEAAINEAVDFFENAIKQAVPE